MVFFELLPRNQTINFDVYCRQLNELNAAVKDHGNATPQPYLATCQKLLKHGWEVMLHPPYSLDLAPLDYSLFRSLQNSLNGKILNDDVAVKSNLVQFLADKNQKFYERGIMKLPRRWQKIIEQNGKYIID